MFYYWLEYQSLQTTHYRSSSTVHFSCQFVRPIVAWLVFHVLSFVLNTKQHIAQETAAAVILLRSLFIKINKNNAATTRQVSNKQQSTVTQNKAIPSPLNAESFGVAIFITFHRQSNAKHSAFTVIKETPRHATAWIGDSRHKHYSAIGSKSPVATNVAVVHCQKHFILALNRLRCDLYCSVCRRPIVGYHIAKQLHQKEKNLHYLQ